MYQGYKIVQPSDIELTAFYMEKDFNHFDCLENEYVIFTDENKEVIDKYRWTGSEYKQVRYEPIKNVYTGNIRPRNPQQCLAFDMLQDEKTTVKVLTGIFGSGKTMIMILHAVDLVQKGKVDKIVWVRNNIEVKDSAPLGALPGSSDQKLLPFAGPLLDHIGGLEGMYAMMDRGQLELQHLGYIRGRDIKNSIIIASEAENLTVQHVQLLIGRVGEGSQLWLDGDHKQVDKKVFKDNNGLQMAINRLAGQRLFGYVDMPISERSETARLADLLD